MLKIREEQMASFQSQAEATFIDRMVQYLREHHALAVEQLPPELLRQRVVSAIARGRSHGLTWQSSLAGFVALMFEVAPNFDQHPAFRAALNLKLPDENDRIRALHQNVTDEDWEEAREYSDSSAWTAPSAEE